MSQGAHRATRQRQERRVSSRHILYRSELAPVSDYSLLERRTHEPFESGVQQLAGQHKGNRRSISGKGRIAMGKKAFDKIAEGLSEALAIARGEAKPAKLHIPAE